MEYSISNSCNGILLPRRGILQLISKQTHHSCNGVECIVECIVMWFGVPFWGFYLGGSFGVPVQRELVSNRPVVCLQVVGGASTCFEGISHATHIQLPSSIYLVSSCRPGVGGARSLRSCFRSFGNLDLTRHKPESRKPKRPQGHVDTQPGEEVPEALHPEGSPHVRLLGLCEDEEVAVGEASNLSGSRWQVE